MSRKNRRNRRNRVKQVGYSGSVIRYTNEKDWWHSRATPDKVKLVAEQVFGGTYYCVGDRKAGRVVENPKD